MSFNRCSREFRSSDEDLGATGAGCAFGGGAVDAEAAEGGDAACLGGAAALVLLGFGDCAVAGAEGGGGACFTGAVAGGMGVGATGTIAAFSAAGTGALCGTAGFSAVSCAGRDVWQPDRASDAAVANAKIADRAIGVYLDTAGSNRQPSEWGQPLYQVATTEGIAQTSGK